MMNIQKIILALAALTLAACATHDSSEMGAGEVDKPQLKLAAVRSGGTTMRADVDIQTAAFDADELIRGYISFTDGGHSTNYDGILLTTMEADENNINPLHSERYMVGPSDRTTTVSAYALYPSWLTSSSTSFTVSADQREAGDATIEASDNADDEAQRGYKGSDMMWGTPDGNPVSAEVSPIKIQFSHKMAKIVVNAKNDGTVAGLIIQSIKLKGFKRTIGFNATTGVLGDAGTLADASDIAMSNYGAALLPPKQTVATDAEFIEVTTNNGVAMFKLGTDLLLQEGHQYTFNLDIGMQAMTVRATTITDWSDDGTSGTITPLAEGEFAISTIDDVLYDATAHEPVFNVQTSEGVFASTSSGFDERFTKGYYGNTNAGEAVVLVTGKTGSAYEGKVASQTFTIQPKALTLAFASDIPAVDYNATEQTAGITMTDPDSHVVLNSIDHYTASNDKHTNANEDGYTVTITGKGNYTGSIEKTFVIHKVAGTLVKNSPSAASVALNPGTTSQAFNITFMGGTLNVTTTATAENEISVSETTAESTGNTESQFSTTVAENSKRFVGTVTFSVEPDQNHTAPTSITCDVLVGVTLANSAVGDRVDANGYAYLPTATGVTPIGMVAYKNGNSGIVMAKNYMSGQQSWNYIANGNNNPKNLNGFSDLNNVVIDGYQWICGSRPDYEAIGFISGTDISEFRTKLVSAGCTNLNGSGADEDHWTCTENESNSANGRNFFLNSNGVIAYSGLGKERSQSASGSHRYHVRPIFKF